MRIRSIRPEFWSSEDIAALPWDARLIYIGLWSYVDDNGVGRDVEQLITAALFPLEDSFTEASVRVHGALKQLQTGGQITRYRVAGKPYLHVTAFDRHQKINRPTPGRYPGPTSENAVLTESLTEPSVSPHADVPLGEGEKGRRGEVLSSDESDVVDRFDEFWRHYPRKDAKADARRAWKQVTKDVDPQTIIDGLTAYAFKPDRNFQPLPASWLRGRRWEDEGASVHQLPTTGGQRRQQIQVGDRWRDINPDEWVPIGARTRWVSA